MSKLKGVSPSATKKRLKAFFYGEPGTGKTYCAINFPKAYYIDTEKGAEHNQYVDLLNRNNSVVYQTRDYEDLYEQITALATENHSFETIIIDPITPIYVNLVDMLGRDKRFGIAHGRHYSEANKRFERLLDLLLRIDMNVIITSHAKKEYGQEMSVTGQTFDAYKKLNYVFDLVIETKIEDKIHRGIVRKSRIKSIPPNDEINFNYQTIQSLICKDMKIFGSSIPIALATEDQVKSLNRYFSDLPEHVDWINKCLASANVSDFSQLTTVQAEKMLEFLLKKESKNGM